MKSKKRLSTLVIAAGLPAAALLTAKPTSATNDMTYDPEFEYDEEEDGWVLVDKCAPPASDCYVVVSE